MRVPMLQRSMYSKGALNRHGAAPPCPPFQADLLSWSPRSVLLHDSRTVIEPPLLALYKQTCSAGARDLFHCTTVVPSLMEPPLLALLYRQTRSRRSLRRRRGSCRACLNPTPSCWTHRQSGWSGC
eukprot:356176-Chlamydomonas_euryale.AAC.4